LTDNATMQGDFGEKWLSAVASGCGMQALQVNCPDLDKADIEITYLGELNGWTSPSIKVQVKTTEDLRLPDTDAASFDLDVATYDVLRKTNQFTPRVLVVFRLEPGRRIEVEDRATHLIGRGYWLSLVGADATPNTSTVAVRLPLANRVDGPGLLQMLSDFGVRRSSIVPEVSPWD
jgi:hypothetical protein